MNRRLLTLIALVLLTLPGCGGAPIDARQLAQESAEAFDKAQTFHFTLTVKGGQPAPMTTPLGGLQILSAEGDLRRPQDLRVGLKAQLSEIPLPMNLKAIVLDQQVWLSNPLDPTQWVTLQDTSILDNFSPAKGVSDVLRGLNDAEVKGQETLQGVETHHVVGSADAALLAGLTGGSAPQGTLAIEAWIGTEDKLPRKIVALGPLDPSEPAEINRTVELSHFDKSVTIEQPE